MGNEQMKFRKNTTTLLSYPFNETLDIVRGS